MNEADHAQINKEAERAASIKRAIQPSIGKPLILNGVRVCIVCEEEIEQERLIAMPNAVRCLYCQSIYERERGR